MGVFFFVFVCLSIVTAMHIRIRDLQIAQSSAEDWESPDGDAISGWEPCSPRMPPSSWNKERRED